MTLEPSVDQKAFWMTEHDVAASLGVAKEVVRKNRGPEKGRWTMGPRKQALWSFAGVDELRRELSATMPELASAEPRVSEKVRELSRQLMAEKALIPADDGLKVLEVMGCRFDNRSVMHCVDPESEPLLGGLYREPIVCHVADAYQFMPGMRILARRRPGRHSNVWEFAGNPAHPEAGPVHPRGVGRW